ncbi:MFS transporter small subunit [Arthrobacter sp. CAN_A1]
MKAASTTFVWALVVVPLAYGVFQTLTRVSALFGA